VSESTSVRVEIFDHAYNLRGTDPDYITQLADFVDTKMRMVAQQTTTVDSARLAVLAAINIADELHTLLRKYESINDDQSGRLRQLGAVLDEVLQQQPARIAS
jgi:cell division protein ZapA